MCDQTIRTVAMLYWLGYAIFLFWKITFPNSIGLSFKGVCEKNSEELGVDIRVVYAIGTIIMMLGATMWPYWVITRPFRKEES